jgi:uncharacterized protein
MDMIEKDITINSYGNELSGTVCLPEASGKFPLVVMIHGTGPLDRDENMPGQQLNVFNTIAHTLAREGIASLRYDKRGCGRSSGDYYSAGNSDLTDDAINWFDALKEHDFCDPTQMFILAHSEGCIIAPQVSLKRPAVVGLILLCPFLDHMESILIKQATQLQREFEGPPGVGRLARKLIAKIMGITVASQKELIDRLKSSNTDTLKIRGEKITAKSLRQLIHLDPPAIFSQVTCPMLLIGAEKDLQCDPADVNRIAKLAKGPADAQVIKNLTHILRLDEGQPSFLGNGKLIKQPVAPIVLELIAGWLNKQCFQQKVNSYKF